VFSYEAVFKIIFPSEGYFACGSVYDSSNQSFTTGHRDLGAWGASKQRDWSLCILPGFLCQCVTACDQQAGLISKLNKKLGSQMETRGSASSAPATGGACRCQQLGRWGFGVGFWVEECLEPASKVMYMVCLYRHICFPLMGCHLDQLERGTGRGHGAACVFCLCGRMWLVCM